MQKPVIADPLRQTRTLLPVDQDIVAAFQFYRHAHGFQCAQNRLRIQFEIDIHRIGGVGDDGKVQIPEIVINRPAAGRTAHNIDLVFVHIGLVDFFGGVLIAADDDRIVIAPQKDINVVAQIFQHPFFQGQIVARV